MSRVSVIIPAYNPGAFLDEALASVLAQTFEDWECVVVDDGSTEDLSRIDALDPRVRRIRQENRGLSIARNVGLMQSHSEYVAFVDADDLWAPHKLQAQVEMMDANLNLAMCQRLASSTPKAASINTAGGAPLLTLRF